MLMSSVPVAGGDIQDYLGQAGPLFETISDKLEVLVDCETPDSEKKKRRDVEKILYPLGKERNPYIFWTCIFNFNALTV